MKHMSFPGYYYTPALAEVYRSTLIQACMMLHFLEQGEIRHHECMRMDVRASCIHVYIPNVADLEIEGHGI